MAYYPVTPIVVSLIALILVLSSLIQNPVPTIAAMGFIVASFPVYYCFYKDKKSSSGQSRPTASREGGRAGQFQELPDDHEDAVAS